MRGINARIDVGTADVLSCNRQSVVERRHLIVADEILDTRYRPALEIEQTKRAIGVKRPNAGLRLQRIELCPVDRRQHNWQRLCVASAANAKRLQHQEVATCHLM